LNDIYSGVSYSASGILVYASGGLSLNGNTVSNTHGIVVYSGGADGKRGSDDDHQGASARLPDARSNAFSGSFG
jgi:hypothetical protein